MTPFPRISSTPAGVLFSVLLVLVGVTAPAYAGDEPIPSIDKVLVTASRLPPSEVGMSMSDTVITREYIDLLQPANTVELLRGVSGVHIDLPGGQGGVSSIYIRGADPNYTQIFIDGVQVNDPTNSRGGSFDVSAIDIDSIVAVEITRGAGSAVRGADAMAGTINFITYDGGVMAVARAKASVGRFDVRRQHIKLGGPVSEQTSLAISASVAEEGATVLGNQYYDQTVNGNGQYFLESGGVVRLVGRLSEGTRSSFPDDSGGPKFAVLRSTDERKLAQESGAIIFDQPVNERWNFRLEASLFESDEDAESPGVAPGLRNPFGIPKNSSVTRYRRHDLRAFASTRIHKNIEVVSGLERRNEKGASESQLFLTSGVMKGRFDLRRQTNAGFIEGRWQPLPRLSIEGGGRITEPEAFRTQTDFSFGVIALHKPLGTKVRANWGEGFKLPSFFALGNAIVGNPDLRPETSTSYEISVTQPIFSGKGETAITLFDNSFFNNIDYDTNKHQMVNRTQLSSHGGEFSFEWRGYKRLSLKGQISFADTRIHETGEKQRKRPTWRATSTISWQWQRNFSANLAFTYVDTVLDSSIPTGDLILDDYFKSDLALNWRPMAHINVGMKIDNLSGARYQEVLGFEAPGVSPFLMVEFLL